jgi:putative transcriptional regulator
VEHGSNQFELIKTDHPADPMPPATCKKAKRASRLIGAHLVGQAQRSSVRPVSVLKYETLYPYCAQKCMKREHRSGPPVNDLLRELHHRIEAKERSRISQALMAERLGISSRTYLEYLRGKNSPVGMRVVLDLLCMLDDQSMTQIIQHWRSAQQENGQPAPEATT